MPIEKKRQNLINIIPLGHIQGYYGLALKFDHKLKSWFSKSCHEEIRHQEFQKTNGGKTQFFEMWRVASNESFEKHLKAPNILTLAADLILLFRKWAANGRLIQLLFQKLFKEYYVSSRLKLQSIT